MSHRRPAILSKLSLSLALALVASGQGASYIHQVTVHHGVCEEHGEPVDVARGPSVAVDSGAGSPASHALHMEAQWSSIAQSTGGEEADDHCVATTGRREWSGPDAHVAGLRQTLAASEIPAVETARANPLSILRFAPKHSPPAA